MASTRTKNSKVSANTPSNAAPTLAGSEVAVNPPANPVAGAGQAQGSSQSPTSGSASGPVSGSDPVEPTDPLSLAFLTVVTSMNSVKSALGVDLQEKQPGRALSTSIHEALVVPTIVRMAKVLQLFPSITTTVTPASLLLGAAQVDAIQQAEDAVSDLLGRIQYTRKAVQNRTWKSTRSVYSTASRDAKDSGSLTDALEPIASVFVKTKRDVAAVKTAATESLKSANATVKATKATTKATTAHARVAVLAPQLAATGQTVVVGTPAAPAPAAPAPPAAAPAVPAPSATAPSAAAPAATPGTPGSTTIR